MHIDWWTLALQTVNVLVLIWILGRFFFRPIMDIVAKRQEEANGLLSKATADRKAAQVARAEAERARAAIGADQARLIGEARQAARSEGEKLLAAVSQETAKRRADADAAIERARAAAEQAVIGHAGDLALDIARRLLGRLPSGPSLGVFVEGVCQELRLLSPEAKTVLTSARPDHPIQIVTANPLSQEERAQLGRTISRELGVDVPIAFSSDPDLVAGLELRGRATTIRNNWRTDLDQIREELNRGDQSQRS